LTWNHGLSYEDIARQICAMVRRWRIFCDFLRPVFQLAAYRLTVSDLHPEFAMRHTMCGSMVDIQSATAENMREKKKDR